MTTPKDDLPCRDLVEMVSDYLEGTFDPETEARIRTHLTWCDACSDYVEQIRAITDLSSRLRDDDVPQRLRREILSAFRARQS